MGEGIEKPNKCVGVRPIETNHKENCKERGYNQFIGSSFTCPTS